MRPLPNTCLLDPHLLTPLLHLHNSFSQKTRKHPDFQMPPRLAVYEVVANPV